MLMGGANYNETGYKYRTIIIGVPSDRLEEFTGQVEGVGHIKSINKQSCNITSSYNKMMS